MANPLVPAAYDLWWSIALVVIVILLVASLVSLARASKSLTPNQALVWTLVAIFVPVAGPASWFAIGRRARANPKTPNPVA